MDTETKIAVHVVVDYAASSDRIVNVLGFVSGVADVARLRSHARLVGVHVGPASGERMPVNESTASLTDGDGDSRLEVQLSMAEIAIGVANGYLQLMMGNDAATTLQIEDAMHRILNERQEEAPCVIELDELALLRVRVFGDLWKRGHFVAFGSKFGVDFLLYEADPSSCHSFAMVLVKGFRTQFTTVDIVSHCRVAKMVKKTLLFASQQNEQILYLSLDHAVLAAAQSERH